MGTLSLLSEADAALAVAAMKQSSNANPHNSALHQAPEVAAIDKAWVPSGGGKITTDSAIMLENVVKHFRKPNILDVKLGARLWADDSPPAKREKLEKQAAETTSKELGLRISGMRVWRGPGSDGHPEVTLDGYQIFDKHYGKNLTVDTVHEGFEKYFNVTHGNLTSKSIKKVIKRFIEDLEGLQTVLEAEECRIYSSSLLFVYEGDLHALNEAFATEKGILASYDTGSDHAMGDQPTPNEKSRTSEQILPNGKTTPVKSALRSDDALPRKKTTPSNGNPSSNGAVSRDTVTSPNPPPANSQPTEPPIADLPSPSSVSSLSDDIQLPPIQSLKLIDFAHAQWTPGQGADENLLHGIRNVINILHGLSE